MGSQWGEGVSATFTFPSMQVPTVVSQAGLIAVIDCMQGCPDTTISIFEGVRKKEKEKVKKKEGK